jgi:hypothetical protein
MFYLVVIRKLSLLALRTIPRIVEILESAFTLKDMSKFLLLQPTRIASFIKYGFACQEVSLTPSDIVRRLSGMPGQGLYCLLIAVLTAGCSSTGPKVMDSQEVHLQKQAVTVIRSEAFRFDWDKEVRPVQADLESCAADAITEHFPDLHYIPRETFTKTAFPNLPSESAPTELRYIRVLIEKPTLRQRLKPLNLRYIVYVGGHTEIQESNNWIVQAGFNAVLVMGASTWTKETNVNALIFDLKRLTESTGAEEHAAGTSWMAGVLPFIVGWPDHSEHQACRQMGEQITQALARARRLEAQQ